MLQKITIQWKLIAPGFWMNKAGSLYQMKQPMLGVVGKSRQVHPARINIALLQKANKNLLIRSYMPKYLTYGVQSALVVI